MFHIIHLQLADNGDVVARESIEPEYELFEDAIALAEFDASRCEDYGYDDERDCWWGRESGRTYRFLVEASP